MAWTLKSGRVIEAPAEALYLRDRWWGPPGQFVTCGDDHTSDMSPEQHDGDVDRDGNPGRDLTHAERREIADAVVAAWEKWASLTPDELARDGRGDER